MAKNRKSKQKKQSSSGPKRGLLSGMRSGMKSAVGTDEKKKKKGKIGAVDVIIWLAILGLVVAFLVRRL